MDKSGSLYDQLILSSLERLWAVDSKVKRLIQNIESIATVSELIIYLLIVHLRHDAVNISVYLLCCTSFFT